MSRSAHPAGPRHADVLPEGADVARPLDVNALDSAVWPETAARDAGVLTVGGLAVTELARRHATPLMLIDERDVRARAAEFTEAFTDADVYYAGKAFLCTQLTRWIDDAGLELDVCTGGELAIALAAGFPPARIAFHGNNKSRAEIERAVTAGVGRIVLDSMDEVDRVAQVAAALGRRQQVLVRVTVGVEAHTHEFIATAHEDQKFGLSLLGGAAMDAVDAVLSEPALQLVGLHSHIGSQIFDTAGFEIAAHRLVELLAAIRDRHGVQLPELDLGGGLGIAYVSSDSPQAVKNVAARLRDIVERECATARLTVPRLSVEPGRAVVGRAGITVYEVGTVKRVELDGGASRTYVSIDGGMSDNLRTALYDAQYTAVLASRKSDATPILCRVVGKHCESGDIVVRDAWLPGDIRAGDLVAVAATGAYCRSMASNYNYVPRPAVVGVCDGVDQVLIRRETEADLLMLDAGFTAARHPDPATTRVPA